MKISLNLNKTSLNSIVEILQDQEIVKPQKIADKCMFYLFTSAFKKLLKKQIDKSDDFKGKPFKMSFKYEEATGLYMELCKIKPTESYGIYENNLVDALRRDLHQKLF